MKEHEWLWQALRLGQHDLVTSLAPRDFDPWVLRKFLGKNGKHDHIIIYDHIMILENSGKHFGEFSWTWNFWLRLFYVGGEGMGCYYTAAAGSFSDRGFQVLSPPLRHAINGNCTQRRGLPGWKDARLPALVGSGIIPTRILTDETKWWFNNGNPLISGKSI